MSVSVAWAAQMTVTEVLPGNTGSAADAKRTVTHDQYNESGTITGATTPPATQCAHFLLTLSSGAGTIDLRNLSGTNGAVVDLNGLKVQLLRIKNLGANPMTFVPGASNGIDLLGGSSSVTVPPGGVFQFFFNDQAPDVAAADKTIDVTGTGAQTAEISIVAG